MVQPTSQPSALLVAGETNAAPTADVMSCHNNSISPKSNLFFQVGAVSSRPGGSMNIKSVPVSFLANNDHNFLTDWGDLEATDPQ